MFGQMYKNSVENMIPLQQVIELKENKDQIEWEMHGTPQIQEIFYFEK